MQEVRALSEGLQQEVKPYNIRTTVISPGVVAAELPNSVTEPDVAEHFRKYGPLVRVLDRACGGDWLRWRPGAVVAEIISLESAILALTTGRLPNRPWARLSPVPAFVEKLRILIEDLTTPTDGRVPPFLRIVDADPKWRRYLFGRQRPDTRVEEISWYWRFLLMMTLLRQLTWTRKFKESELSTI